MKISKIRINNYLHFKKRLSIDLTYPKGHPDQGKPLNKICFLGQSGTGKTTILNLIKYFTCEPDQYDTKCLDVEKFKNKGIEVTFQAINKKFSKISSDTPYKFDVYDYSRSPRHKIEDVDLFLHKEINSVLKNRTHVLLNFPFCVVSPEDVSAYKTDDKGSKSATKFNEPKRKEPFDPLTGGLSSDLKREISDSDFSNKTVWDFTHDNIRFIWKIVFNNISDYILKYKEKQIWLAEKVVQQTDESQIFVKKFEDWVKTNPNPIQTLADKCLNTILEKFSLEVEIDINKYSLESKSGESFIIIKGKNNGEEIQYPFLSTGTKQIMLTSIPLFFLKPSNAIILFDQPETSLYPNIQWLLPQVYIDVAPNDNQFFFATHSPVVASAFDPWEVVELRFNEATGEVYRKEYYNKEASRDISSYTINPKLLRWDSGFKILFDLNRQGNPERMSQLRILSELEVKIKSGTLTNRKKAESIKKYMELASLLDWNTDLDAKN
jgi:hypothetical protein